MYRCASQSASSARIFSCQLYSSPSARIFSCQLYSSPSARVFSCQLYSSPSARVFSCQLYLSPSARVFRYQLYSSPTITAFAAILSPRLRMCLTRMMRAACAALSLPGQLFLLCLLLDTLYLACVHQAALLPASSQKDNTSDLVMNNSLRASLGLSLSSSSQPSSTSLVAAPPSSSSSSLSAVNDSTHFKTSQNVSTHINTSTHYNTSQNATNIPSNSISSDNFSHGGHNKRDKKNGGSSNNEAVSSPQADKVNKEFPMALVVASSTAAVSILVFFCLSYLWHTRQLDRRAQKLAIRLAAEANDIKCSQCRSPSNYRAGSSQDSGSDSAGEESCVLAAPPTVLEELNSLNEEDEDEALGEDGSRRKAGGVGRTLGSRRGRRGRRSGSRSSRKWSGHSGGQNRSSLVTDQEILNHFASRRHSTFFI